MEKKDLYIDLVLSIAYSVITMLILLVSFNYFHSTLGFLYDTTLCNCNYFELIIPLSVLAFFFTYFLCLFKKRSVWECLELSFLPVVISLVGSFIFTVLSTKCCQFTAIANIFIYSTGLSIFWICFYDTILMFFGSDDHHKKIVRNALKKNPGLKKDFKKISSKKKHHKKKTLKKKPVKKKITKKKKH